MINGVYKQPNRNLLYLSQVESKNQIDICILVLGNSLGRLVDFNLKTGRILRRYNVSPKLELDLDRSDISRLNMIKVIS